MHERLFSPDIVSDPVTRPESTVDYGLRWATIHGVYWNGACALVSWAVRRAQLAPDVLDRADGALVTSVAATVLIAALRLRRTGDAHHTERLMEENGVAYDRHPRDTKELLRRANSSDSTL